jgi:hypothetical protein
MMNSPSGAVDPETHFPLQNQENITHGQVGIVVRRPDGSYGVVMASTRGMTEEGRQAAISTVTAETPDLVAFSNIVGVNKLTNEAEVADNAESDVVSILDDDSVGELGQFRESFMMVESLLTGAQLITFYSESSKQLVRMNANELKATLLGAIGRFSFVEATTDEDGKTRMKVVSKENKDEYKAVAANLKADFEKIIMKKKFQVSKERLTNDTSPFVSPINGVTYPSYFAFLTSEDALGTPREGSVGSNAILAVDVSKNEHGHVFYDVGLSLNNLGTIEGDATTQRELDANSIPFPKPPAAPTTPAPSAPVTNAQQQKREEEIRKRSLDRLFPIDIDESTSEGKKLAKEKEAQEKAISQLDAELSTSSQPTPQAPAAPVSESEILEVPSGPMEGSGIFAFMQPTAQPVVVPSSPLDEGAKQGSITDLGDFMSRFKVPEGFNPGVSVNDVAPNVQDAIGEEINQKCKGK